LRYEFSAPLAAISAEDSDEFSLSDEAEEAAGDKEAAGEKESAGHKVIS
jgi:hypothetical protein